MTISKKKNTKLLIGRTDYLDFKSLNLSRVPVKIDTGAYTSSIHCPSVELKEGVLWCTFLEPHHSSYTGESIPFDKFHMRTVKSSNGISEIRYSIHAKVVIFGVAKKITLTLAERSSMTFPVLLGRRFISAKYLVDASQVNLSKNKKKIEIACA